VGPDVLFQVSALTLQPFLTKSATEIIELVLQPEKGTKTSQRQFSVQKMNIRNMSNCSGSSPQQIEPKTTGAETLNIFLY